MSWQTDLPVMGHSEDVSPAHDERLRLVAELIVKSGAKTVIDLGCGSGALLQRLIEQGDFEKIVGVDPSLKALAVAQSIDAISQCMFLHGSFLSSELNLAGFDAAAMVETIEHVEPSQLSRVEHTVFSSWRPKIIVMTTPNSEYNPVLGLAPHEFRHADHKFEWDRRKFHSWARGVAERNGYQVLFEYIGPKDPILGSSTQLALFSLIQTGLC
jgi:2-polyprenyl-3-methyl-5-hydroxy-6-metoxy-1,4-benzoquinol methylase